MKDEVRPTARVYQGNSARMDLLRDGEADMVFSSPPYFSSHTESLLRLRVAEQNDPVEVQRQITEYALTLRPVFEESRRILRPGGALVLQTKDIRYGKFLLPLADTHCEMFLNSGLFLVTRVQWLATPGPRKRLPGFVKRPLRGAYRASDTENFMVFSHPEGLSVGSKVDELKDSPTALVNPLWRLAVRHRKDDHPFASPRSVIRRFIALYSSPGDLIVDPFAGFGTILREAVSMGRRGLGWDIDRTCVAEAEDRLT